MDLMTVHPHHKDVQIGVMIIERLHAQIETPVFRNELPGLHIFIRLGK